MRPWEMTKLGYRNWVKAELEKNDKWYRENPADALIRAEKEIPYHRDTVKLAIAEGKPVQEEVLRDYPELVC